MRLLPCAGVCLIVSLCSAQTHMGAAAGKTSPANPAFEKMKTLAGEWEAKPEGMTLRNTFRVFAEGSALLHLEQPPGMQEIVTIFYPVGAELRGDHYCFMKNQPRYVAQPSSDPNVIKFELRDITNLKASPGEEHMHGTTWRFIDANHLTQEWQVYSNGKQVQVNRLEFTRVK